MTRETKIGLLVGLAFIIVIGILLSDHINTTTDPIRADATQMYDKVQGSVDAPESRTKGSTDVVIPPQPVVPHNTVPTQPRSERHVDSGDNVIIVSPGKDPSTMELPSRRQQVASGTPTDFTNPDPANANDPTTDQTPSQPSNASPFTGQDATAMTDLQIAAMKQNEKIVSPNGSPVGISPAPVTKPVVITTAGKQIKAEEGDSVSKLASKYMGANSRANREAIIKANPSMTPDGHLVFAGRTYTIPMPVAPTTPVAATPTPAPQTPAPVAVTPKPAAPAESGNFYTVKETDTLWKIASSQLGSGVRWEEIKKLNTDVLKGGEQVRIGMRLKLPNKVVASAN